MKIFSYKTIALIMLHFTLLPQICYAEHGNTTVQQVKKACESAPESPNQYLCMGFINGAVQTYLGMQNLTTVYKDKVCLHSNVGLKDLRVAFLEFTNTLDAKHLDADADVALMSVLILKFPCHTK
jgi:uncharacterized protein YehS (DUF1456 family)